LDFTHGRKLLADSGKPFRVRKRKLGRQLDASDGVLIAWLDVDVDVGQFAKFGGEGVFELRGLCVRTLERKRWFDFEVEVNIHTARRAVRRDMVNGQMFARGHGLDAFEDILVLGARFGVHHNIGAGRDGANSIFDTMNNVVAVLKRIVTRNGDMEISEDMVAGAANPRANNATDAGELGDSVVDLVGEAAGGGVKESVHGASSEPPTDVDDDEGNHERGDGVGASAADAEADEGEAAEDDQGTPDVGAEMKCVGFQRLALVFLCDAGEGAGTGEVHHDGDAHRDKCPDGRVNRSRTEEESLDGFIDDPGASQKQEKRLGEGAEVFDLAVTVLVVFIGSAVADANGEECDEGRNEIEGGMGGFREDAEAAGEDADDRLHRREEDGGDDGGGRDESFLALLVGQRHSLSAGVSSVTVLRQALVAPSRKIP